MTGAALYPLQILPSYTNHWHSLVEWQTGSVISSQILVPEAGDIHSAWR